MEVGLIIISINRAFVSLKYANIYIGDIEQTINRWNKTFT
jgi:hypothetical protein